MTCLEPDLFDRLNSQIAHAQMKQLYLEFAPLLNEETSLVFATSSQGKTLTIICNPDRIAAITAQRSAICQRAWKIAFIASIRLYCEDKHLWTISSSKSCSRLEATRSFAQEGTMTTLEAPERTATSTATTKRSPRDTRKGSPKRSSNASASISPVSLTLEAQINTLAQKTGKTESQILAGILNSIPEDLVVAGFTKLVDQQIEADVEVYRQSMRSEFLGTPSTNRHSNGNSNGSRTKDKPATKTTSRRTPTAAASTVSNQTRFRSFVKGARISTTLSNFLAAQNYDAVQREEIVQAIAKLPDTAHPEMADSLAERCVGRILKIYRGGDRASVIAAAQKLGNKSVKSESTVSSESVETTA